MEQADILNLLNDRYPMRFSALEFIRDGGSVAYAVFSGSHKCLLRMVKHAFFDTAVKAADIHAFLQKQGFSVPPIIFTKESEPYVRVDEGEGERLCILYEFIEGGEVDPEKDAEAIGSLLGRLHSAMRGYSGALVRRDRHYYLGRYIDILRNRQYPRADKFEAYADELWEKVRELPRGYCHGDMYRGNIHKTPDGRLFVLDFDTSCEGFPMYDPTLICNMTHYFKYRKNGYDKSKRVLERFLPEYSKYSSLSQVEVNAFCDLIAVYHYQVQATVMEIFGYDCVDYGFFDEQLGWLYRWREQCGNAMPASLPAGNMNGRVM